MDETTALLSFFVVGDRVLVWLIDGGGTHRSVGLELPQATLTAKVRRFRELVRASEAESRGA